MEISLLVLNYGVTYMNLKDGRFIAIGGARLI